MITWIYLPTNNPVDSLALFKALQDCGKTFNLVRRSVQTELFLGCKAIQEIGFPAKDSQILRIDMPEQTTFKEKVDICSNSLGIDCPSDYSVNLFGVVPSDLPYDFTDANTVLLYLNQTKSGPVDLIFADNVVSLLKANAKIVYSIGSIIIPPIMGTIDLRGVISNNQLLSLLGGSTVVITNDSIIAQESEACGARAIFWNEAENETLLWTIKKIK